MDNVKIPVFGADGKCRGSLFRDGSWHDRWSGVLKNGVLESMVCKGPPDTGCWFLLQYVFPRQISGEAARDDLLDEASKCLRQTPVQALRWFVDQPFGPPPALVFRVRRWAELWPVFAHSAKWQALLNQVVERRSIDGDDPLLTAENQPGLQLLRNLELVHVSESGGKVSYFADAVVKEQGVQGFLLWTQSHLSHVQPAVKQADGDHASLRGTAGEASRPANNQAHRVGAATLKHLRTVLDVGVQVRWPQATRGRQELRAHLAPADREALDRALATEHARRTGTPLPGSRPEAAIRAAHNTMLPHLRDLLANLREAIQEHGALVARPIAQETPSYGPTVGSHPPQLWTGPSAHDVLAQLADGALGAFSQDADISIILPEEEWERLRIDVLREAGELARTASTAAVAAPALQAGPEHAALDGPQDTLPIRIRSTGDDWQPSAHQQLILGVLRRDGRLRTGVLWKRVFPKHVDVRAHQYAMRELVVRDQVKTEGRGKAIEYWLP